MPATTSLAFQIEFLMGSRYLKNTISSVQTAAQLISNAGTQAFKDAAAERIRIHDETVKAILKQSKRF